MSPRLDAFTPGAQIPETVGASRREDLLELGEHRIGHTFDLVVELLLRADCLEQLRMAVLDEAIQLRLIASHRAFRQMVDETGGSGIDDQRLALDRQRLVLPLLPD